MAAVYITSSDVDNLIGESVKEALLTDEGETYATEGAARLTDLIGKASSFVRSYALNSGYALGGDDISATAEDDIKLPTLGAFVELAYARPEKALPLPANWNSHPARLAYAQIVGGEYQFYSVTPSATTAVGGYLSTTYTEGVTDAREPRATPSKLSGY